MRFFIVVTILQKELLETLRDRRTLILMILLPMLVYPLCAIGVSKFQGSLSEARRAQSSKIAVWGELPAELQRSLEASRKLELSPWTGAPPEIRRDIEAGVHRPPAVPDLDTAEAEDDATAGEGEESKKDEPRPSRFQEPENPVQEAARAVVSRRDVEAVLVPWPPFSEAVSGGREGTISIYFDSVRRESTQARDRIERLLRIERRRILSAREVSGGLSKGFSTAIDVRARNVAPKKREVGQVLGAAMPMILILMALLGAFLPAIDLTAGEKERGTMQTLLCAPLHPIEIIWGKFLAVWSISLLTSLVNIISLALTFRRILPGEFDVAPSVYALMFALLVPVTFLISALFLALASFARGFKDGQNMLMPVYLPITLLSGLSSLPGVDLNRATSFIPVLNISLLIKAVFLGEAAPDLFLLTLGSSALYAALALVLAARVFEREHVLLGGRESARVLFGLSRRQGGEPSAAFSLTALGVILVVSFYASLALVRSGTVTQLVASQYGLFLLPTLVAIVAFGFSVRETLALRLPSLRAVAGSILVGLSSGVVAIGLLFRLVPVPESVGKKVGEQLLLQGQPLPVLLLLVAVTPALCEELLFRGLLFSGLRRLGWVPALIFSALLFAFAHATVYHLIPVTFLGLSLGYARLCTGSIASGMLIHALNNGLVISLLYYQPAWAESLFEDNVTPWRFTLAAIVVFALGIGLLRSSSKGSSLR
jgi:sodium transport system permease protein